MSRKLKPRWRELAKNILKILKNDRDIATKEAWASVSLLFLVKYNLLH